MEALTTKDGKTILYENGIAEVVDVKDLELRKADIEKRVKTMPTDEELLVWAKENYPMVDHREELKELESIKTKLNLVKEK